MANRLFRDWTKSDRINSISVFAERFFTRVMMRADDFGCFYANPQLVKSELFPLKDDVRVADISRWMAECQNAGLIAFYQSDKKEYLFIHDFGQRLRTKKRRFPEPPEELADNCLPEVEHEEETEEEVETEFLIIIGREKFFKRGSEILKNEYRRVLESHLMGALKGIDITKVLETFDLEYPNYTFKDSNHLSNAVKGLKEKIQKNSAKKENGQSTSKSAKTISGAYDVLRQNGISPDAYFPKADGNG